jgi:glycosyltransferase involved in cell wall biosynthesis
MKLSLCILTMGSRRAKFERLTAELARQMDLTSPLALDEDLGSFGNAEVEVLYYRDDGERTIGSKRQRLLLAARGDFVACIDDDDEIHPDYLRLLLPHCRDGVDCVGFKMEVYGYAPEMERAIISNRYKKWENDRDGFRYVRCPHHKVPVRREHALRAGFNPSLTYVEDIDYSMRLVAQGTLQREIFVDEYVYRYMYESVAARRAASERDAVIINVGVGHWYPRGTDRLVQTLAEQGWGGAVLSWRDVYPDGAPTHEQMPYAFKLRAFDLAREQGFKKILWLDSSAYALAHPWPLFRKMDERGYYFWTSHDSCAPWCNDRSLDYFGFTREQARGIPMLAGGCIGLHVDSDKAQAFYAMWKQAMADGIFPGPWRRGPADPEPPEYRGHRHDQTAASLAAHEVGMEVDLTDDLCACPSPQMPRSACLAFGRL